MEVDGETTESKKEKKRKRRESGEDGQEAEAKTEVCHFIAALVL